MILRGIVLLLCLVCFNISKGQNIIYGQIVDAGKNPVPNATISYSNLKSTVTIGFAKSDAKGIFQLKITNSSDSITIKINCLGFEPKAENLANKTGSHKFVLDQRFNKIEEVKVSGSPIFMKNDTINYSVRSLASKSDNTIGDLIQRLPGVEVKDGKIYFQGKAIQKYMVNNLDIMGGRYGTINNNLSVDAVKNIQIVENDQPIKVLDSVTFNDGVSLNLELRDISMTGNAQVGGGLNPGIWDLKVSPMLFGRRFQMVNNFQSNNVGYNSAKELTKHYQGRDDWNAVKGDDDDPKYVSLREVNKPGLEESDWLDNKILLFNSNLLFKVTEDLHLKGHFYYYNDYQNLRAENNTQYLTSDQKIVASESINNRYKINVLNAGLVAEKNAKNIYLHNELQFKKKRNRDVGELVLNKNISIDQNLNNKEESISNRLDVIKTIGKEIFNIRSNFEYNVSPRYLIINPGQFEDLLNSGKPYHELEQDISIKTSSWNNKIEYIKKIGQFNLTSNIEANYKRFALKTDLQLLDDSTSRDAGEMYKNNLENSQFQSRLTFRGGWENRKWKTFFYIPFESNTFHVNQNNIPFIDNEKRNSINPHFRVIYMMNVNNELSIDGRKSKVFNEIEELYSGYILNEYRTLNAKQVNILTSDETNFSAIYKYKNILKGRFLNLLYTYNSSSKDYMVETKIDSLGRTNSNLLDIDSWSATHNISGTFSKMHTKSKTLFKLKGILGFQETQYSVNDELIEQLMRRTNLVFEATNNYFKIASVDYKYSFGNLRNSISGQTINRIISHSHLINIMVYPSKNQQISFSNFYTRTNFVDQNGQYFLDAKYRYSFEKKRVELSFIVKNILNNRSFVNQVSTDYQLSQSIFYLRKRQFLLSVQFKF